ncbi:hypothetical protein [Phocaeicola plebeius]|nr:hypothetical protein [Phocaeicola plebeius]
MFLSIGMLKQKYFLTDIFILSAEKQPIKLSWRKIEWLRTVACSSDENFDQSSLENIDFRVSVAGQSRVAMQKNGSGDFQAGDEVALRVYEFQPDKLQDNKLLYCEGNRWTSSLYWKDWKGTPHFYAVWPSATQVELWEGTCWYVHRVSRNQSAEKDFLFSDLLVADAEGQ